jgi:hypothetical protein
MGCALPAFAVRVTMLKARLRGLDPVKAGLADRTCQIIHCPPRRPSPTAIEPGPPSMTAAAVRARPYRQRRKNGVRCLVVEISRVEMQALVKAVQTQQTDADVKHAIHALLNASYMTGGADRGRTAGTQLSQGGGDGESRCAWCGLAGVVGYTDRALCSRPRFAGSTLWFIHTALRRSQRRGLAGDHDALRATGYRLPAGFSRCLVTRW